MQTSQPKTVVLIVKAIAVVLIGLIAANLLISIIFVSSDNHSITQVDKISWCERDYRNRDFAELYEELTLSNLYGEDYDVYWEAVEGYNLLVSCYQWREAEQAGVADAHAHAQSALQSLETLAQNSEFSQNSKILADFVSKATALF